MTSSHALIFANGAANDGQAVRQTLANTPNPLIIAADGGARLARDAFHLQPNVIIGDMDSLSAADKTEFAGMGVQMHTYPAEKDETDLELALLWAVERGIKTLRIIGALGNRVDQMFGNVYLLALPQLHDCDVKLVSDHQYIWLARPGQHLVQGKSGDTFSLLPFSGDVTGIITTGLYYPMQDETLYFGPARGISNVLTQESATVQFKSGQLIVVHTLGKAE